MIPKQQLRKQADFVANRFRQLNEDFLVMYGYLIYESVEKKESTARKEVNSLKSKTLLRVRQVKSDITMIYAQQYKDNGVKKMMDDYFVMFPDLDDFQERIGVTIKQNGKTVFYTLNDAVDLIDDANNKENLARQISDSGLRIRQNEFSYRIDNYIRYEVLKGIKDINSTVQEALAEKMGANGWEIDYHENPRPSHAYMGGRQFVIGRARWINGIFFESFEEIAEPRLIEPNCLHFKIPIICGVTKPLYEAEQLAKWKAADASKVKYKERTYTKYEASQVQRRLADEIRKCDDRIKIASAARLDQMRRIELSKRRILFNEYQAFSKACGLDMKIKNR